MSNRLYKQLVLGIVSLSLAFAGCKKDEVVKNNFTFNGNNFFLDYGALDNLGESFHTPATYQFEVVLTSKGISFDNALNEYAGSGDFIRFFLYSTDPSDITSGLYTYDNFSSGDPSTMDNGLVGLSYDVTTEQPDSTLYEIETGVVDVIRRGPIYEFNIDVYINNLKQVKGYYAGRLDNHILEKK